MCWNIYFFMTNTDDCELLKRKQTREWWITKSSRWLFLPDKVQRIFCRVQSDANGQRGEVLHPARVHAKKWCWVQNVKLLCTDAQEWSRRMFKYVHNNVTRMPDDRQLQVHSNNYVTSRKAISLKLFVFETTEGKKFIWTFFKYNKLETYILKGTVWTTCSYHKHLLKKIQSTVYFFLV